MGVQADWRTFLGRRGVLGGSTSADALGGPGRRHDLCHGQGRACAAWLEHLRTGRQAGVRWLLERPSADAQAVIDHQGAVRGLRGLHVAGASVFPDMPRGKAVLPTTLVGAHLSGL